MTHRRQLRGWCARSVLILCTLTFGCASKAPPFNLREKMLESSRRSDPEFPDGVTETLTKFSYLGDVRTKCGILHVVEVSSVITGMLSAHGKGRITVFDQSGEFVGSQFCRSGVLWCEGSKVFLYGLEECGDTDGNAWDFADGFEKRRLLLEERYGSYLKPESEGKILQ